VRAIAKGDGIIVKAIDSWQTKFIDEVDNYFDKDNYLSGTYFYKTGGNTIGTSANSGYNAQKIRLHKGQSYYINNAYGALTHVGDLNNNWIKTFDADIFPLFYTPTQECYLFLTITTWPSIQMVVNTDTVPIAYIAHGAIKRTIPFLSLDKWNLYETIDIIVDINGTGEYTSLTQAISSIVESNIIYNVYIKEGTYDIVAEKGGYAYVASITSGETEGLKLPNNVNLIGLGNKDNIIIKGYASDSVATLAFTTAFSTIVLQKTNTLENLTITAYNCRYAVHDESGNVYKDITRIVKNCVIKHLGNAVGMWGAPTGYGSGCSANGNYLFEDTICYSKTKHGFSMHDNNYTVPTNLKFKNCWFITGNKALGCLRLSTYFIKTFKNSAIFDNCNFSGMIQCTEETTGSGNAWNITGGGNNQTLQLIDNSVSATKDYFNFSDETKVIYNDTGATLTKYTVIKNDSLGILKMTNSSPLLFMGIVLNDIANGEYGVVKQHGYIYKSDTNLTGTSMPEGSKIGISATGTLVIVTTGDIVGVAVSGVFIKLY